MTDDKKSVLIIDDDSQYLELLTECLETMFNVQVANSLTLANEKIEQTGKFDIALVDEYIGDEIGSDWIKQCVDQQVGAKSFVLYSGFGNRRSYFKGIRMWC